MERDCEYHLPAAAKCEIFAETSRAAIEGESCSVHVCALVFEREGLSCFVAAKFRNFQKRRRSVRTSEMRIAGGRVKHQLICGIEMESLMHLLRDF